ncbi:hypothetical protein MIND_01315200 [Mycena indigotica]|uniref:F-box domain-containing protein n=1 Tax=Mycena indigotica TaxID=2126181 RepID=A0A8H6S1Y9_9AGAR|nr:uncharacterized protein MIND_01315200 [Mycena indigotica]KAF7290745.1 hypothetical protein MIND_01315200 [Mycena indigotica]
MHRCLAILEILENIFSYFSSHYAGDIPTLAALARTCKAFMGPALDVLWYQQGSLENALKCLPDDCWKRTTVHEELAGSRRSWQTIKFTRNLTQQDWEHAQKYLCRVKQLDLPHGWNLPGPMAHIHLLEPIERSLPGRRLFPNIRHLSWKPSDRYLSAAQSTRWLRLFVGPNLRSLEVHGNTLKTASDIHLLASLDIPLAHLHNLVILLCNDHYDSVICTSSELASKLGQIKKLTLPAINAVALNHLSLLPNLSQLTLTQPQIDDIGVPASPLPLDPQPFAALSRLDLRNCRAAFAVDLINSARLWKLAHLEVNSCFPELQRDLDALYVAAGSRCTTDNLRILCLGPPEDETINDPATNEPRENYALTGLSLVPLFKFSNLHYADLQPPAGFLIDDDTISKLARSWPLVEYLTLRSGSAIQARPLTTIRALRTFAKHCKLLVGLSIPVDASDVPDFDTYSQRRITQSNLTHVNMGISPIADPSAVARFLSGHFPCLDYVETLNDRRWSDQYHRIMERGEEEETERSYHVLWTEVSKMLSLCQAVRQEEQFWAEKQGAETSRTT